LNIKALPEMPAKKADGKTYMNQRLGRTSSLVTKLVEAFHYFAPQQK
jgi:hypothetical protein